eukprot:365105-Chlamydomonas_euryale.AAC.8
MEGVWPSVHGGHVALCACRACGPLCMEGVWPSVHGGHVALCAWRACGPLCMEGVRPAVHGGHVALCAWRACGPMCMEGVWPSVHGGHVALCACHVEGPKTRQAAAAKTQCQRQLPTVPSAGATVRLQDKQAGWVQSSGVHAYFVKSLPSLHQTESKLPPER